MDMMELELRHDRNARLFGATGQKRLYQQSVVLAGTGGLGSAVAQHLALLGIKKIVPIDDEGLSETNRNRFVGAHHSDPAPGTRKVSIIERLVKDIDPSIAVDPVFDNFVSPAGFNAIRTASWVFGCFDEDGPRSILNDLCVAYNVPLIDLASDVPEEGIYGGRVTVVAAGLGCLHCREILDEDDIRRFLTTDEQLEVEDKVYGIENKHLEKKGPAVSPINGVIASLATMEFMSAVTGLRDPTPNISYLGHQSKVTVNHDKPNPDCLICASRDTGAIAGIERYLEIPHIRNRRIRKFAEDPE
ncbi:ThiF family adenylyltransferase [uncultured Parasphingorhabdus sp.]|uniref:HesA/MoeB/ThiF family protein n=1 Tax=uncultured Parasphingorhabdus sp. TaxID=2709694 RepID=UPI0030DA3E8D|tara:strand:+ start:3251 stop:4156 length:906 start_codon:yes stop_codon:yes gene_type:complete